MCYIFFLDVAPLSAPAFSFCFPLLNAMLRGSSGSTEEMENMMNKALQVISEHSQLRAETDNGDIVDEVEPNILLSFVIHLQRKTVEIRYYLTCSITQYCLSCVSVSEWPRAASTCRHAAITDKSYFNSNPETPGKQAPHIFSLLS